jgi:hypothetical protein
MKLKRIAIPLVALGLLASLSGCSGAFTLTQACDELRESAMSGASNDTLKPAASDLARRVGGTDGERLAAVGVETASLTEVCDW